MLVLDGARYDERRRDVTLELALLVRDDGVERSDWQARSSRYERRLAGGHWTSRRRLQAREAPSPGLRATFPSPEALTHALGPVLGRPRAACALRWQARERTFANSEGRTGRRLDTWWDVLVEERNVRVADGAATVRDLRLAIERCAKFLADVRGGGRASAPPARADLLLAPTAALVLLHELVAHGVEEQRFHGAVVGPATLAVDVADGMPVDDDEGVRRSPLRIIDRGRIRTEPILDRHAAFPYGGRPSGVAQAASHGRRPRPRLTAIAVRGGDVDLRDRDAIRCLGVAGGGHARGRATLRIDYAVDRRGWPVAPFAIALGAGELRRALTAVGGTPEAGRSARCVKHGEALPCLGSAPWILLEDVRIAA